MAKRFILATLMMGAPMLLPTGAHAQNAAQNGVLVIYGNDKCPTNSDGEEIVVCRRLDEGERYRIPKTLREPPVSPQRQSWAVRQAAIIDESRGGGIGSCSAVGPGGMTGCLSRQIGQGKAEARQRQQQETDLPLP